jgi:hypothetical protein
MRVGIRFLGVSHGVIGDFDPHDTARHLRQQGSAIPLPRGDIKDIQTSAQRASEKVSMQMLDLDLAARFGGQALARPRQRLNGRHTFKDLAHGAPSATPGINSPAPRLLGKVSER